MWIETPPPPKKRKKFHFAELLPTGSTEAVFTSAPRALRQGLDTEKSKKKKKSVCTTRYSSAVLGLLMRNPIVSGSTDLWQRVWMFYSEWSGGSGSSRRMSAGLQMGHCVPRCTTSPSTCPSKVEKGRSARRENWKIVVAFYVVFSPPVWWYIMRLIGTGFQPAELRGE